MHASTMRASSSSSSAACRGSTRPARPPALIRAIAVADPSSSQQRQWQRSTRPIIASAATSATKAAGPTTPPPDYTSLDRNPLNAAVMALFRARMVDTLGGADSPLPANDYRAIIELTRRLNARAPTETRAQTRQILRSLFPSWLPGAFAVLFSRNLPALSARLNAWATALSCQWLMGPCAVVDIDPAPHAPEVFDGKGMGVKVERCRYLEEAGCAAVCANSCRLPTQAFFARDMGLPLAMEPDFADFSCTFRFGHRAPEEREVWGLEGRGGGEEGCGGPRGDDAVMAVACFQQCPSPKRRVSEGGVCGGIFEDVGAARTAAGVMTEKEGRS